MAVAWRRASTPSLDSQKWKVLAINEEKYLIKALFDDQGYHVMISDLSTIWEEDPGAEKILMRGKVSGHIKFYMVQNGWLFYWILGCM